MSNKGITLRDALIEARSPITLAALRGRVGYSKLKHIGMQGKAKLYDKQALLDLIGDDVLEEGIEMPEPMRDKSNPLNKTDIHHEPYDMAMACDGIGFLALLQRQHFRAVYDLEQFWLANSIPLETIKEFRRLHWNNGSVQAKYNTWKMEMNLK